MPNNKMDIDSEEIENDSEEEDNNKTSNKKNKVKDESENFKKLPLREQIMKRPGMYMGSIHPSITKDVWILQNKEITKAKKITQVAALFKIFDEILVNAADNKQRDKKMKELRVNIDTKTSEISVYNSGKSIPVQVHATEKIYIPQMVFGELLTSSNYNDNKKKTTGGTNGYGAKLTNLFSKKKFEVEAVDGERRKKYYQKWSNHMLDVTKPVVTDVAPGTKSYTKVTFIPDLEKFGMKSLKDNDTLLLLYKRVYDVAGANAENKLDVYLNDKLIKGIDSFQDYIKMYLSDENKKNLIYKRMNDRFEVAVAPGKGDQLSLVNSINTSVGGTHCDAVYKQLFHEITAYIKRKDKKLEIKDSYIKNHLFLFMNCLVDNPEFDTQTKTNLITPEENTGTDFTLSNKFITSILESSIVDAIIEFAKFQGNRQHKQSDGKKGKKPYIPKHEEANEWGGKRSHECTLILTEGDSAKALVMAALGKSLSRDFYGVFPMRGKVKNVRGKEEVSFTEEIIAIKRILGLIHGFRYKSTKELNYGHVMIMTDSDADGSHIKVNIIHIYAFICYY